MEATARGVSENGAVSEKTEAKRLGFGVWGLGFTICRNRVVPAQRVTAGMSVYSGGPPHTHF